MCLSFLVAVAETYGMKKKSDINPFGLRMDEDLRKKVESAAKESGRSINAEIAHRLAQSFSAGELSAYSDGELVRELMDRYGRDQVKIRLGWDEYGK